MKLPTLKRDTAAEIRRATEQSAQAATKLVSLREERARLLTDADVEAIAPIDAQIVAQECLIATLQEKLRLLDQRHKEERHANRLTEKEKALAAFAKEYRAKRVDPAVHIIELWGQLGDAYAEYRKTRRGKNDPNYNEHLAELKRQLAICQERRRKEREAEGTVEE